MMYTYEQLNTMSQGKLEDIKEDIQDKIYQEEMKRQELIRSILYLQEMHDMSSFRTDKKEGKS